MAPPRPPFKRFFGHWHQIGHTERTVGPPSAMAHWHEGRYLSRSSLLLSYKGPRSLALLIDPHATPFGERLVFGRALPIARVVGTDVQVINQGVMDHLGLCR